MVRYKYSHSYKSLFSKNLDSSVTDETSHGDKKRPPEGHAFGHWTQRCSSTDTVGNKEFIVRVYRVLEAHRDRISEKEHKSHTVLGCMGGTREIRGSKMWMKLARWWDLVRPGYER